MGLGFRLARLRLIPRGCDVELKKTISAVTIAGVLGFGLLGLGVGGVASAVPSPSTSGTPLPQKPHGPHGPGGGDWNGPGWNGPGWYGPGWYAPGISACISATGPWGYVTGTACI